MNDKGTMTCGLFTGFGGEGSNGGHFSGIEVPYTSTVINVQIVDLVAEVTLTYKFTNTEDKPIQPTFIFPLNETGVLCDVDLMVEGDKRIGAEVDSEAMKRILEHKETFNGDNEAHVIKVGEMPPSSEVTIKCTYIAIFHLSGDAIRFVLPADLIPAKQPLDSSPNSNLRVSFSMEMHDRVIEVTSDSHPDSIASSATFVGGKATAELLLPPGGLSTDLVLLVRVKDITAPRAWTSVGSSGTTASRMSMLVLCPTFQEADNTVSKEGEVVIFLDVREDDKADVAQVLRASLEKLPKWAYFNVWASFDGAGFAPVFEQAVSATEENFQGAIVKIKSRVSFSGEDTTLLESVQSLLSQSISFPPRIFFFVTSMGSHVDEVLKVIAGTSVTTKNVVVLLKSKWNKAALPQLLSLNGGCVVRSRAQELEALLPKLIEKNVQPNHHLSISSTPNPKYQFPFASPPLFCGSSYVFFFSSYDQLSPSGEVAVNLGLAENGSTVKAKHVTSQSLHRLGSHALLSELNAGLRKDLLPHQKDIAAVLYSPWTHSPTTPKGRHVSHSESGMSPSDAISLFRNGMGAKSGFTLPPKRPSLAQMPEAATGMVSPFTIPNKKNSPNKPSAGAAKGLSLREQRIMQHKSASKVFDICMADYADRAQIPLSELEPCALDIGLNYIKDSLHPSRQLTAADAKSLRSVVMAAIANTSEFVTDGSVNITRLKTLIQDAVKTKWSPESDASHWYEVHYTSEKGARAHMEDRHCVVDGANELYGLSNQPRMAFFGVFDGHSGKLASEFTKTNLPFNVLRHPTFDAGKLVEGDDLGVREALTEGYLKTDAEFTAIAEKDELKAGTTAVTLLLLDDYMVISNVGDSEAVVCRDGKAVSLSTLHTPLNEKEKQRITKAGGAIVHYGTWRVNGVLAVTRSIGDRTLKEQVTAHPDTTIEKITDKDDFIILATDGLWDTVKHQDAVDMVLRERATPTPDDPRSITRKLVDEATKNASKDNITAVLVYLKKR